MRPMKLKDAPLGARMVVVDRMDDEVRWTIYERIEGEASFNPLPPGKPNPFIRVIRHRTMQGMPGRKPRYDSGERAIESQTDGRIEVVAEADLKDGPNHDWTPEAPAPDVIYVLYHGLTSCQDNDEPFAWTDDKEKAAAYCKANPAGPNGTVTGFFEVPRLP